MLLAAILMGPAQIAAAEPAGEAHPIAYVILADEGRRTRLERIFQTVRRSDRSLEASSESGLFYVGCVTAWRHDLSQKVACIQARLSAGTGDTNVVLDTYDASEVPGESLVRCIGTGGSGSFNLSQHAAGSDRADLADCLESAVREPSPGPMGIYENRFTQSLEIADVREARARAASVMRIAVDHVGFPRGIRGTCQVQGRVDRIVRGTRLTPRGRVELGVPCASELDRRDVRTIARSNLREGSFANIYLSEQHTLLDYELVTAGGRGGDTPPGSPR